MMFDAKRFFLLTCFLVSSTSAEIKGKPGDDVLLQCQGRKDAVVKLLEWSKPDLKSDDYVFYLKNGRQHKEFQHESFHNRVELKDPEMKDRNFSVTLKNVTINDTGTYECYVGYGGKRELINTINLKVEPGTNKEDGGDKVEGHKDVGDKDVGDKDGGNKDGGDKDDGNKDGGDKSGHVGLIVGLLVVLLLVAVVGFVIYRKCKVKNQNSNPPAGEQTGETQMFQV